MLLVGLTGNVAAGKSAVATRLAELGATLIDADALAREAVAPGTSGLARIVARWGDRILAPDGTLDRATLRHIVFADPTERTALETIVHPEVERLRGERIAHARARGATLVVCDIPLLFEAGLEGSVDRIVLVDAPVALRRDRLMRDRGLGAAEADAMIAAQKPATPKRARAHHVIENSGSKAELEARVTLLHIELDAIARRSA